MQAKPDAQLLREYARQGSEAAFGELVARYTDLVYSAVLRQVASPDIAEEIAQSVFTDLARKASALTGKFDENATIVGWLYRSSRYALFNHLRAENRRHIRESHAMESFDSASTAAPDWERIRPVLDEAMAGLNEEDRQAMLLRFFQNQGFQAVGATLGISDDAAQKRVGRALEKLRVHLARHGITTTAALLSAVLSTNAVQTAPAGLAAKLAGASLAGTTAKSATTLAIMTLTSFKTGIIASGIAAVLAVWLATEHHSLNKLRAEDAALRQQLSQPAQPPPLISQPADSDELQKLRREHEELVRLRGEIAVLRNSMEKKQIELTAAQSEKAQMTAMAMAKAESLKVVTVNALKIVGTACRIYAGDNNGLYPTNFGQIKIQLGGPFPGTAAGLGTNSFEFIDYGRPVPNTTLPYYILAREKQPRQMPDGRWSRMYLFVDGSVQEARPDDGNFDAWEQMWYQQRAAEQAAAPVSR